MPKDKIKDQSKKIPTHVAQEIVVDMLDADKYKTGIAALRAAVLVNRANKESTFFRVSANEISIQCEMAQDLYIVRVKCREENVFSGVENGEVMYSAIDHGIVRDFQYAISTHQSEANRKILLDILGYSIAEAVRFEPIARYISNLIAHNLTHLDLNAQLYNEHGQAMMHIDSSKTPKYLTFTDLIHSWGKGEKITYLAEVPYGNVVAVPLVREQTPDHDKDQKNKHHKVEKQYCSDSKKESTNKIAHGPHSAAVLATLSAKSSQTK